LSVDYTKRLRKDRLGDASHTFESNERYMPLVTIA
jgi:hypothetical protein